MFYGKKKRWRFSILFIIFSFLHFTVSAQRAPRGFYISTMGSDGNPGTKQKPWKTLLNTRQMQLMPGDSLLFHGGQIFTGSLLPGDSLKGTSSSPILISSYGTGRATLTAGNGPGIVLRFSEFVQVKFLKLTGSGRKKGNTEKGIMALSGTHLFFDALEISGFQKSGLEIVNGTDIRIDHTDTHDNGYAGISVSGLHFPAIENNRIYIGHSTARNNPGDPTELNNHSGNGIVVGLARNVLIEYCTATGNGWDMPRKGNGPVGIWAWQADSVVIQYCLSYRNKTSPGSMDGGGFDLDGGVTHSLVQYNLAYENQGYGYGIFQFSGATPWHHNTFRYNISYNDGNTTLHGASVLWWNGSKDSSQFHDAYIYQNLFYNSHGYALGVIPGQYDNSRFYFLNNIITGKNEIMGGDSLRTEHFFGNRWWSIVSGFKVNGMKSYSSWIEKTGMERLSGKITGKNAPPGIILPTGTLPLKATDWKGLRAFRIRSPRDTSSIGINMELIFGIDKGQFDFFGNKLGRGNLIPGPDEGKR